MSTSRKRNKASKGKKNSPGHRTSLNSKSSGEGDAMMPDLKEPAPASGASAEGARAQTPQGKAKADKPLAGAVGGNAGGGGGGKSKAPAARMVYFDPEIILPPADKRSGESKYCGESLGS